MKFLAIDTETALIRDDKYVPDLVCLTWFNGEDYGIVHWKDAKDWIVKAFKEASHESPLVFHNAPFDLAVLAKQFDLQGEIFRLLDENAICDTQVREKLIRIAEGSRTAFGTSLKDLVLRYFEQDLEKDKWRLEYEELREVSLNQWPQGAKDYAIKDAIVTGKVYEAQQTNTFGPDVFNDEPNQNRANYALYLAAAYGVITSKEALKDLETRTLNEFETLKQDLIKAGLVDVRGKRDSKATAALMLQAIGEDNVPRTPTGRVKTDEEACENSDNPDLKKLARYRQLQTLLSKDIDGLKKGLINPIHTRYDVLLNTGRTSSSKPNLQNPRREPGVRECYVPRKGYVFCSVDYEAAELHTLAQVCYSLLGFSSMKDRLNEGADLHLYFAAQLLGISYEEALKNKSNPQVKETRQHAKVANFGFPGGMGPGKLTSYAKNYGIEMTEAEAKVLKDRWVKTYPETQKYFKWINSLFGGREKANISHLRSNRFRGNVFYTEACNSFFQGLAADGAKAALYRLTEVCYMNKESPLFGCRPVLFLHDEIICEMPEGKAHEAATEMARIMVEEFTKWTPDVPVKAEPALMRCWSKKAEAVFKDGKLIPWEGKTNE